MEANLISKITSLRHELHQYPELSGQEINTALLIRDFIQHYPADEVITEIGGHGIAAIYNMPNPGPKVMIRAELDALPMDEPNQLGYRSTTSNISHKCGHDGHMSMVAALSSWLNTKPLDRGAVVLLFQPAEENGQGAKAIIEDPKWGQIQPDYIFALHNLPGYPKRSIVQVSGQFNPTVQSLAISIEGQQSHASEPDKGNNPANAIAAIINRIGSLSQKNPYNEEYALITPIHIKMGKKDYGISPGDGEVHFTMRCWTTERMDQLEQSVLNLLDDTTKQFGVDFSTEWLEYFPTVHNDPFCNKIITKSAKECGLKIIHNDLGCKFGEDFGWFTKECKGAMFGLGAGLETPPLHNEYYDFPDDIISDGYELFRHIISEILK